MTVVYDENNSGANLNAHHLESQFRGLTREENEFVQHMDITYLMRKPRKRLTRAFSMHFFLPPPDRVPKRFRSKGSKVLYVGHSVSRWTFSVTVDFGTTLISHPIRQWMISYTRFYRKRKERKSAGLRAFIDHTIWEGENA